MNTQTIREFHLGDILSITTGRLLAPTGIDGVYALLKFMTGDDLFTHQLPRAGRECEKPLRDQLPTLAGIVMPQEIEVAADAMAWLAEQVKVFGEFHPVTPVAAGAYVAVEPVSELVEMMAGKPVIVLESQDGAV